MATSRSERRRFLRQWGALAGASFAEPILRVWAAQAAPNPVGYATISWPERKFEHALETIASLGFQGVQMLGWVSEAYSEKASSLRDHLQTLKLEPVVLSCSEVNLDPRKPEDETAKLRAYARFLQTLGGLYLQVTDGGDPRGTYSAEDIRSLGARMSALGKVARDYGLTLAYHPHFGTLGETREGLGRVLDATDPRDVKLIVDVGHLTLGGCDPSEVARTYHERLVLTHFKDVRKDVTALARQNRDLVRKVKYHFCEIGEGVVNFPAILQAFREVDFRGWIVVELDGYERRPGGADESARINRDAALKLGLRI